MLLGLPLTVCRSRLLYTFTERWQLFFLRCILQEIRSFLSLVVVVGLVGAFFCYVVLFLRWKSSSVLVHSIPRQSCIRACISYQNDLSMECNLFLNWIFHSISRLHWTRFMNIANEQHITLGSLYFEIISWKYFHTCCTFFTTSNNRRCKPSVPERWSFSWLIPDWLGQVLSASIHIIAQTWWFKTNWLTCFLLHIGFRARKMFVFSFLYKIFLLNLGEFIIYLFMDITW